MNLEPKERPLVLAATSTLDYETMKSSLKRIYAYSPTESATSAKEEPAFVSQNREDDMAIDSSQLDPSYTFWTGRGKSRGKFTRPGRVT